ncbi:hypothetical protein [Actinoplanes sp. NPDC051859]|uniref:hypothetical protein n=1 Tax=Actinoplanes sp. NPDC051859 TaxID=3363909 RepID=UPI0037A17576
MTSYYVPSPKPTKDSGLKFDIMGTAVLGNDEMRTFAAGTDGSFALAYRSDGRPPAEIFISGFTPRKKATEKYPPTGTLATGVEPGVALRLGNVDMDTDCAVSLALDFNICALFPYDPVKEDESIAKTPYIYLCRVNQWLDIWKLQTVLAPHLAYAKEVAVTEVKPQDIVGCVKVARTLKGKTITYTISDRLVNGDFRPDGTEPKTLIDIPKNGSALAPSPITAKTYGDVDGKTVFGYVQEILKQMKGTPKQNTIAGWKVPEVGLTYTLPGAKKTTNPYS